MTTLTESNVEQAALAWLDGLSWNVAHGPDLAPDTLGAERADYGQVVLEQRLRDALALLNPDLPASAVDETFQRKRRKRTGMTGQYFNHCPTLDSLYQEFPDSGKELYFDGTAKRCR